MTLWPKRNYAELTNWIWVFVKQTTVYWCSIFSFVMLLTCVSTCTALVVYFFDRPETHGLFSGPISYFEAARSCNVSFLSSFCFLQEECLQVECLWELPSFETHSFRNIYLLFYLERYNVQSKRATTTNLFFCRKSSSYSTFHFTHPVLLFS